MRVCLTPYTFAMGGFGLLIALLAAQQAPKDYEGRRFHAPPKPLAADAITQDWPGFLGPARDGRSLEAGLEMELSANPGLVVTRVLDGSPAQKAGLLSGDEIVATGTTEFGVPDETATP